MTQCIVGDENGKVFVRFKDPVNVFLLDPQSAFEMGEQMAKAAHKARFGEDVPDDVNYLAQQVRLRVTEQMRDRKINRVAIMLNNFKEGTKTPGYWAQQIVDTILSDIA